MLDKIVLWVIKTGLVVSITSTIVAALVLYKSYILLCMIHWFFPEYGFVTLWQIFGFLSIVGLVKSKFEDAKDDEGVGVDQVLKKVKTIGKYLFLITIVWGMSYAVRFWVM